MGKKEDLEFKEDEYGKEQLLKEGRFQVMMEWEKPYMQACIDALKPFGDVLEIGFGCGYSAEAIQTYQPKSHTIIECDPMVAEKAREFAKKHKGVTIVEDTWQNALALLGVYDAIFFDDYPLESEEEMQNLRRQADHSHVVVKKGQQVLLEAKNSLSSHFQKVYKDEDLLEFFQLITQEGPLESIHLLTFLDELKQNAQITEKQAGWAIERFLAKGLIKEADLASFVSKPVSAPFAFEEKGDRLFEFLSLILEKHTRKGSRFSCFLEDPTSKFENQKFIDHIITNPWLDYKEEWIDIQVPENCKYYKGKTALVITITRCSTF